MRTCLVENCGRKHYAKGLCSIHYRRYRYHGSFEKRKGGAASYNWKGGIADYPNHWKMKKQRLLKISQTKGRCELCGRKGKQIHHKDGSKTNHSIDNLMFLCQKCHGALHRGRKAKTSKYLRLYGMTFEDISKKLKCDYPIFIDWHKRGLIKFFLGIQ